MKIEPPMIPFNSAVVSPPLLDVPLGDVFMIGVGVDVTLARTPSSGVFIDVDASRTVLRIIVTVVGFGSKSSGAYVPAMVKVEIVIA